MLCPGSPALRTAMKSHFLAGVFEALSVAFLQSCEFPTERLQPDTAEDSAGADDGRVQDVSPHPHSQIWGAGGLGIPTVGWDVPWCWARLSWEAAAAPGWTSLARDRVTRAVGSVSHSSPSPAPLATGRLPRFPHPGGADPLLGAGWCSRAGPCPAAAPAGPWSPHPTYAPRGSPHPRGCPAQVRPGPAPCAGSTPSPPRDVTQVLPLAAAPFPAHLCAPPTPPRCPIASRRRAGRPRPRQ